MFINSRQNTPKKPMELFKCPADIPYKLEEEIKNTAIRAFKVLNCRDICRIDIRLNREDKPHVLDVNPLPGLIPNPNAHSCLPEAARVAGYTYDQLIYTILSKALERYNLKKDLIKL